MKLSAKPISSPGRTDKFPPPLMRFLRSNVGSKSRGRSRSSPMFVRKKSNATAAAVETQEPSSPKVTCMGQVRVRRSSSVASSRGPGRSCRAGSAPTRKQRIRSALFCGVDGKTKPKKKSSSSSCGQLWRKWVPSFVSCRKGRVEEDPPKAQIHVEEQVQSFRSDEEEEEEREEAEFERKAKAFAASCSSSPPKNALLLTRCRSAPYRASSLASRFWGSPNRAEEKEETEQEQSIELENRKNERPTSETESISDQESKTEQQDEQKIEFFKGLERSIRERTHKSPSIEEEEEEEEESKEEPVILTRCKSEPARTAAVFAIN